MKPTYEELVEFLRESNKIEDIPQVRDAEIRAANEFLDQSKITIQALENFVQVTEPGAELRVRFGLDVRVGFHVPPPGGPWIEPRLQDILDSVEDYEHPYTIHLAYETLHPFTDGNGRSGRILWAWQMCNQDVSPGLYLGFLHAFYYQTLERSK